MSKIFISILRQSRDLNTVYNSLSQKLQMNVRDKGIKGAFFEMAIKKSDKIYQAGNNVCLILA